MKSSLNFGKIFLCAVVLISSLGFVACNDDEDYSKYYPTALVTAKTAEDNTFFMQLDDNTTLLPINIQTSPFGDREVRALVNYDEVKDASGVYDRSVKVNWIDSILTKNIAPDLGEENDEVYGIDPVELVPSWVNIAEDGYLTLHFKTLWGHTGKAHFVNLISTNNPDNPYELEFRHNAYGDVYGRKGYGLVAFNLSSLPDTEGETVKLKLIWNSFRGEKSVEFDYCTRKSTASSEKFTTERNQLDLK